MAISIQCSDKSYKQLPGGHCTVTGAKFRAVVTRHGGRLMSMEVGPRAIEVIDSHPGRFSAVPTVLAKPRSAVAWGDVGIGGGRTWVAPQSLYGGRVPFLDLDLGKYLLSRRGREDAEGCLSLVSPRCRETGLVLHRDLDFSEKGSGSVSVRSRVVNHTRNERIVAPWDILQVKVPRSVVVGPLSEAPTAFPDFGNPLNIANFAHDEGHGYWSFDFEKAQGLPMFKLGFVFDKSYPKGSITVIIPSTDGKDIRLTEEFEILRGKFPHIGQAEMFLNPEGYVELEVLGKLENLGSRKSSKELVVDIRTEILGV